MADKLTILRSASGLLAGAKRFDRHVKTGGVKPTAYARETLYEVREAVVSDFASMAAALTDAARDPRQFVIRGEPLPGIDRRRAQRNRYAIEKENRPTVPPHFSEVPRWWMLLDLDKIPLPPGSDLIGDPADAIEHVMGLLPAELQDAACWWGLSSSAGMNGSDTISCRLGFWLGAAYGQDELTRWANAHNDAMGRRIIDPATLRTVQPIYIAAPVFGPGVRDPIATRYGTRDDGGYDRAPVLEIPAEAVRAYAPAGQGAAPGQGVAAFIAQIGTARGFRQPIVSAIASAAATGADMEATYQAIRAAVLAADPGGRSAEEINRYARRQHFDEVLRWTAAREAQKGDTLRRAPSIAPTYPNKARTLLAAETELRQAIGAFVIAATEHQAATGGAGKASDEIPELDDAPGEPAKVEGPAAPVHQIRLDTGGGKSRAALEAIGEHARKGGTVAYFAPRHELNSELTERFRDLHPDIPVAIWRGMDADDPDAPKGTAMCREPDLVRAATGAGFQVQTVCKVCPSRDVCGYRRQAKQKAGVWFLAQQALFGTKPRAVPVPDFLIVDEAFWQAGLRGAGEDQGAVQVAVSTLAADLPEHAKVSEEDRLILESRRTSLALALDRCGNDQRLTADMLKAAQLTAEDCAEAKAIEWRFKPADALPEGLDAAGLIAHIKAAGKAWSARIPRLWLLCQRLLEGKPAPVTMKRNAPLPKGKGTTDILELQWRDEIGASWAGVPALLMDATAEPLLSAAYFPAVRQVADIEIATPHARIIQVRDWSGSKNQVVARAKPEDQATAYDAAKGRGLERVADAIRVTAANMAPGRVLVIAQEAVEAALAALDLAPNVDLEHFNNVNGLDRYRDHAAVIVVGRPLPGVQAVELMAELLADAPIQRVAAGTWPKARAAIRLADGTGAPVDVPRHPDPMAEAVRRAICDANISQSIGRLRLCRRTASNPAVVLILTSDAVLPLTATAAPLAAELFPTRLDIALARADGALPMAPDLLARVYPDLWPSADAAKKDMQRLGDAVSKRNVPNYSEDAPEAGAPSKRLVPYFDAEGGDNWGHSSLNTFYKRLVPYFSLTAVLKTGAPALAFARVPGRRGRPLRVAYTGTLADLADRMAALGLGGVQIVDADLLPPPERHQATPEAPAMPEAFPPLAALPAPRAVVPEAAPLGAWTRTREADEIDAQIVSIEIAADRGERRSRLIELDASIAGTARVAIVTERHGGPTPDARRAASLAYLSALPALAGRPLAGINPEKAATARAYAARQRAALDTVEAPQWLN